VINLTGQIHAVLEHLWEIDSYESFEKFKGETSFVLLKSTRTMKDKYSYEILPRCL
jgi:hypothetical protein